MTYDFFRFLYPETAYGFEQSCLYPTKRALMLVSRAWANLAVEFMYESLVLDRFGVGRLEEVFATLERSTGLVLKKWVKRIDIFQCQYPPERDSIYERLAGIGLPNLRVTNMFYDRHVGVVPSGNLLPEQPLHLMEACGSPNLDRLASRDEAFGSLRCLTLWMVEPLPTPFHLPSNLRRLTIISFESDYLRVQNIFSICDALPNLTHLTLHDRHRAPDRFARFMEIVNYIGPPLRHLSLIANSAYRDWTGADLCTILRVCTRLTELVIPSPLATWKVDPGDFGHLNLQTLGIPITINTVERKFGSSFGIFSKREAFPKLGTIRLVTWKGEREPKPWLEPYNQYLKNHGIRLEDCWGNPLPPVSVLDDQNQHQLSECMGAVPL